MQYDTIELCASDKGFHSRVLRLQLLAGVSVLSVLDVFAKDEKSDQWKAGSRSLVLCLLLLAGVHQQRARDIRAVHVVPRAQRRDDHVVPQLVIAADRAHLRK